MGMQIKCDGCDSIISNGSNLSHHIRIETEHGYFEYDLCDNCHKKFFNKFDYLKFIYNIIKYVPDIEKKKTNIDVNNTVSTVINKLENDCILTIYDQKGLVNIDNITVDLAKLYKYMPIFTSLIIKIEQEGKHIHIYTDYKPPKIASSSELSTKKV